MQTSVQKKDSVRFWSWILEIQNDALSWINIWMVNDVALEVSKIIKQFVWANAKMEPKSKIQEVKMNFNLYEIDLTNIDLINWDWTLTTVAWTPVAWATQTMNWSSIWDFIALKDSNWQELRYWVATWITVNSVGALVGADYDVVVAWWVYWIVLTEAWAWVVDTDYVVNFDYTPVDSKALTMWDLDRALSLRAFRFTNTNENWKIFRIEFFKAYNSEWMNINLEWDEDEDPANMPVSIMAFPDSSKWDTVNLFKITDEQSVV